MIMYFRQTWPQVVIISKVVSRRLLLLLLLLSAQRYNTLWILRCSFYTVSSDMRRLNAKRRIF